MALRTQIYVSGVTVDLLDDISMPLTYSICDVREPQKRTTNYSKTLTLPGTRINNLLFAHLFDVHASVMTSGTTVYNPNRKVPVLALIDSHEVFSGFMQLNNINITNDYGIEYECTMFGNLANIFQTLGDSRLSELILSEYDHTLNKTNQVNSWDTSIQKNGANYSNFSGGLPIGEGYVYPMIDYGYNNGGSYTVEQFFPAVYVKTIFDKIFAQAGFQYQSAFANSQLFKSLIIPFGGDKFNLSNSQVKDRGFRASNNAVAYVAHPQDYSGWTKLTVAPFQDETTSPNWDTGNNYDNSTFQFTPPKYGVYDVNATLELDLTHFPSGASVNYGTLSSFNNFGYVRIMNTNFPGSPASAKVLSFQGGSSASSYAGDGVFVYPSATLTSGTTNCTLTVKVGIRLTLATWDKIYIDVACNPYNTTTTSDIYGGSTGHTRINIKPTSFFSVTLADLKVHEGDTVVMNNVLPEKVKQADFLTSIIRMFNLYIDNDKTVSNKLIVEPRDDFYTSGTTRDWSTKLDYSQPLVITPMGELDNKTYSFTMTSDKDYYNEAYEKKFNETYGYKRYTADNDFIKNDNEVKVIFSPTPLADYIGIDRVIPKIFTIDSSSTPRPKTSNIRILYYGGVKTTANPYDYTATSGTTPHTTYAYAGHLDSATAPTIDLNFDSPKEVFYTATSYTSNNLFNKYWSKYLAQVTNKDSKIVTGYFYLKSSDLANLSFFDVFYFENDLFILNKIYDCDLTQNPLVKCEFVKLIEYPPFVSETVTPYGGTGTYTGGGVFPGYAERGTQGNNSIGFNNEIGLSNSIDPMTIGCSITGGTFSYISAGCRNVSLVNTSGVSVLGGVQNVTVINTSGVTISDSNQIIVYGRVLGTGQLAIISVTTTYTILNTDSTIVCSGGSFTVTLPTAVGRAGQFFNIKNIDKTVVTVATTSSQTIDGSTTQTLEEYEDITVQSTGANWIII